MLRRRKKAIAFTADDRRVPLGAGAQGVDRIFSELYTSDTYMFIGGSTLRIVIRGYPDYYSQLFNKSHPFFLYSKT